MAKREAGNGRTGGRKAPKPASRSVGKKAAARSAGLSRSGPKAALKAAPKAKRTEGSKPAKPRPATKTALPPGKSRSSARSRSGVARGPSRPKKGDRLARPLVRGEADHAVVGVDLSDEEQILAAKYLPRELPPRLFEEERFLFPESYHVNRVRLLVKDPDWIFAYWDVDPKSLEEMGKGIGERALALARLSLRVSDPQHGGSTDILLPAGARWWYVRTDSAARTYRAELGVILPSGEFRRLAESNVVTTPRVGPSAASARRRVAYRKGAPLGAADPGTEEGGDEEPRREGGPSLGPWTAPPFDAADSPGGPGPGPGERPARGGASDTFRPGGASDVHRR